ncbi:MAG: flagellar hook-basal body complex protein FliE [Pseudomonadota bacterium]
MSNMQIDSVLAQIRSLQQQTKIGAPSLQPSQLASGVGAAGGTAPPSFASVMRQGLDRVNEAQTKATNLATAFEKGAPGIELSQVMLESQKASVSFRATVEVRNRLVSAYQEIMNMPI